MIRHRIRHRPPGYWTHVDKNARFRVGHFSDRHYQLPKLRYGADAPLKFPANMRRLSRYLDPELSRPHPLDCE